MVKVEERYKVRHILVIEELHLHPNLRENPRILEDHRRHRLLAAVDENICKFKIQISSSMI